MKKYVAWEEYRKELYSLQSKAYALMETFNSSCWSSFSPISETTTIFDYDEPIQLGINYPSSGTISLEQAETFIAELQQMIKLAKSFKYNGYYHSR